MLVVVGCIVCFRMLVWGVCWGGLLFRFALGGVCLRYWLGTFNSVVTCSFCFCRFSLVICFWVWFRLCLPVIRGFDWLLFVVLWFASIVSVWVECESIASVFPWVVGLFCCLFGLIVGDYVTLSCRLCLFDWLTVWLEFDLIILGCCVSVWVFVKVVDSWVGCLLCLLWFVCFCWFRVLLFVCLYCFGDLILGLLSGWWLVNSVAYILLFGVVVDLI